MVIRFSEKELKFIEHLFSGFGPSIEAALICNFNPINRFLIDQNLFSPLLIAFMAKTYDSEAVYDIVYREYPTGMKAYEALPIKANIDDFTYIFNERMFVKCSVEDVLFHIGCFVFKLERIKKNDAFDGLKYELWEPLLQLCQELPVHFQQMSQANLTCLNNLKLRLQRVKVYYELIEKLASLLAQKNVQPSIKVESSAKEAASATGRFNMAKYQYYKRYEPKPNQATSEQRRQPKLKSRLAN